MREESMRILRDPALVDYHSRWFRKLQDLYDGKGENIMTIQGILGNPSDSFLMYTDPEHWMDESLEDLANRAYEAVSEEKFVPLCIEPGIYGVHFVDRILGAETFYRDDAKTWYSYYLKSEIGQLPEPDLEHDDTWKLAMRLTEDFAARDLPVPLFGLPTIASPLNVALNLYGQRFLYALIDDPKGAEHDLNVINNLLKYLHQWYRDHLPAEQLQPVISWMRTQPPGCGQICGCSTQLISPELYEKFIFDRDEALLGVYPAPGLIHLCGSHKHVLKQFASLENLRCLQVNDKAALDLEEYYQSIRKDQVIYLVPFEGMTAEMGIEIAKRENGRKLVITP